MKRSLFVLALAIVLLVALAAPSVARPDAQHSTADALLIEVIDAGESRVTGNMWHLRGFTLRYRVVGVENPDYATGFNVSVVNWNWNLSNGNASSWGTFEYTTDAFEGGFAGNFTIHVADAVAGEDFDPLDPATWTCVAWARGEANGRGFGYFDGAQLRTSLDSDSCGAFVTYDQTMFFPGS